jgi:hypothetical protein
MFKQDIKAAIHFLLHRAAKRADIFEKEPYDVFLEYETNNMIAVIKESIKKEEKE